jgi:hypothetical protein
MSIFEWFFCKPIATAWRNLELPAGPFSRISMLCQAMGRRLPSIAERLDDVLIEPFMPDRVGRFWHGQRIGLIPIQPFTRPDRSPGTGLHANQEKSQVQFQLAVDLIDTFLIPAGS